jgi:hypothetical protein
MLQVTRCYKLELVSRKFIHVSSISGDKNLSHLQFGFELSEDFGHHIFGTISFRDSSIIVDVVDL